MKLSSPDLDAFLRRAIHAIARFHAKRVVKSVDVARRTIRTKFARAVRIGHQPLQQLFVAILAAPDLRPAQEEPLLAREAIDDGGLLAGQRNLVSLEGHGHA